MRKSMNSGGDDTGCAQRAERQASMRQALDAVAQAGVFADIGDVAAWQHETRTDRAQPDPRVDLAEMPRI